VKKIIASVVAMLATISMVACGDIEEPTQTEKDVTTTAATTTTVTTTGTTVTTTNFTSTLTTVIEVSEKVNTEETTIVNEDPEPLVKSDRNIGQEEMASNPPPGEYHREEVTTTEPVVTEPVEEFLVYKPSTHYIHRNICRWAKDDAYRVDYTTELVARLCSECKPDVSDYVEYVKPSTRDEYSEWDITLLRKIVSSEYGADWVSVEEKAKIVASVMAQKRHGLASTIEGCLDRSCKPWGFDKYYDYYMSDSIIAAVDYYFEHENDVFAGWEYDSWNGNGWTNSFYRGIY